MKEAEARLDAKLKEIKAESEALGRKVEAFFQEFASDWSTFRYARRANPASEPTGSWNLPRIRVQDWHEAKSSQNGGCKGDARTFNASGSTRRPSSKEMMARA